MQEKLGGNMFESELIRGLSAFVPKQMRDFISDTTICYNEIGTDKERKLKAISRYFYSIEVVLNDLSLSVMFLRKNRIQILEHYPNLKSQNDYYKYHFENYYIRTVTLSDIIGRLGILLYSLDIKLDNGSAFNFKDNARKKGFENIAIITEKLIEKFSLLKPEKHKKIHNGIAEIETLNGVVFWSDINKQIGESKTDKILEEHTDTIINEKISSIEEKITEIVIIIKMFLEESLTKLRENIV